MTYTRYVIIAGGRDFTVEARMKRVLTKELCAASHVLHGGARGADTMGGTIASEMGHPVTVYPADWTTHGRKAGPLRNIEMARVGHVLIAFWDGESKGTKQMIHTAMAHGLEVHIYRY